MIILLLEIESPVTSVALLGTAVIVSVVVWHAVRDVVRQRRIQELAARYSLTALGSMESKRLPVPALEANESPFRFTEVLAGKHRGHEIAVWNLQAGYGRHSSIQTVVAVRGRLRDDGRYSPLSCAPCEVQESDGWVMAFRPGQLLNAAEVEALLIFVFYTAERS